MICHVFRACAWVGWVSLLRAMFSRIWFICCFWWCFFRFLHQQNSTSFYSKTKFRLFFSEIFVSLKVSSHIREYSDTVGTSNIQRQGQRLSDMMNSGEKNQPNICNIKTIIMSFVLPPENIQENRWNVHSVSRLAITIMPKQSWRFLYSWSLCFHF